MKEYKNRYGDKFKFTLLEDGNILWEGNFEYHRTSRPNVYGDAYKHYREDGGDLYLEDFKNKVHESIYSEDGKYLGRSEISEKYSKYIYSDMKTIDMVDPSGGPYLTTGMDLEEFGKEFSGKIVESFVPRKEGGYIIICQN